MRILIIEHCEFDALLIRDMLLHESAEFVVTRADQLEAGLKLAEGGAVDLVLLDLSLPDSPRYDTFQTAYARVPGLPIVILTSIDNEGLALRAVADGAQDYLIKARLTPNLIARACKYALERKRAAGLLANSERLTQAAMNALSTQVKRVESLERERAGLNHDLLALDRVLGIVGHELRSPLAGIRAMTELLADERARETPDWHQFLGVVHTEVIRLSDTVDTILEAARLNSGRARWNWSTFEIEPICREAVQNLRAVVDRPQLELSCRAHPAGARMKGDANAVRRLVQNLLSNAIKHTSSGRVDIEAKLPEQNGQWLELSITDTGEGIDPAILSRLGDAFALNSGMVGTNVMSGLGLGLFICRGIVAAHGGRITFRSTLGAGTTVVATLRADLTGPESTPDTGPLDAMAHAPLPAQSAAGS